MGLQSSNSFHFYLLPVPFWPMFLKYQGLGQCAQAASTESNAIPSLLLPVLSSTQLSPGHAGLLCPLLGHPAWALALFLSLHSAGGAFPFSRVSLGGLHSQSKSLQENPGSNTSFYFLHSLLPKREKRSVILKEKQKEKNSAMLTHLSSPWPPRALHCPLPWGSTPTGGPWESQWLAFCEDPFPQTGQLIS